MFLKTRILFVVFGICLLVGVTVDAAFVCPKKPLQVGLSDKEGRFLSFNPIVNCNYQFETTVGLRINVTCNRFRVGSSTNGVCSGDRIVIGGSAYCGNKDGLTVISQSDKLNFTMINGGGRSSVICTAFATKDTCNCGRSKKVSLRGCTIFT